MDKPRSVVRRGLVLSGGGARAAYQVGVLKAIADICPKGGKNPFPVICGTSAGAINSAALAIYGENFRDAIHRLLHIWRNFRTEQVFRADATGVTVSGAHWLLAMMLGGLGKHNPASLLDRRPLIQLLEKYVPCERIQPSIDAGVLESICITASSYSQGKSIIFYHSDQEITPWKRARRFGRPDQISNAHLLASSAIPFLFEAVKLGDDYYGDGSMRQTAPISPAIHMGANRILVIGVTNPPDETTRPQQQHDYPSIAKVAGHILNSIFIDSMEADIERLHRINRTLSLIPRDKLDNGDVGLRQIDTLVIEPSQDIQKIASKYQGDLPWPIRFLLRGIGAFGKEGGSLVSYLLFEKGFCRELIELGYEDAISRRQELHEFMDIPTGIPTED